MSHQRVRQPRKGLAAAYAIRKEARATENSAASAVERGRFQPFTVYAALAQYRQPKSRLISVRWCLGRLLTGNGEQPKLRRKSPKGECRRPAATSGLQPNVVNRADTFEYPRAHCIAPRAVAVDRRLADDQESPLKRLTAQEPPRSKRCFNAAVIATPEPGIRSPVEQMRPLFREWIEASNAYAPFGWA